VESLDPLVNLLVLLTVLSVTVERVTNLLKLRHDDLRLRKGVYEDERNREKSISARSLFLGVLLAILVKADIFEIMTHLDDPWRTLGWVQIRGNEWLRTGSTENAGTFLYAVAGSVITGLSLGFGSKFWHDILGSVYELRSKVRLNRERLAETPVPATPGAGQAAPRKPDYAKHASGRSGSGRSRRKGDS
jgi:hypothetical protein